MGTSPSKNVLPSPVQSRENTMTSPLCIQMDDNYKDFMGLITDGGLQYAYHKRLGEDATPYYRRQVADNKRKHIIVVGAGMAGLSAAYELAQAGHQVTILEARSRVGGRVRTFREGFSDGLHAEAGAMRIPHNHYLAWHYIRQFAVEMRPFVAFNDNAYMFMYGEKVRFSDWIEHNDKYSNKWWPGWDSNLTPALKDKLRIKGILDYYERTTAPVKAELGSQPTPEDWETWTRKWSRFSLEDFLRTDIDQTGTDQLRPWPEEAVLAYKTVVYNVECSESLAAVLRRNLSGMLQEGQFQTASLGMDVLPSSFLQPNVHGWNPGVNLSRNIVFGFVVDEVKESDGVVSVSGMNRATNHRQTITGDAVIVTLPLQILRQLDISLSAEKEKFLSEISYEASTKLILQCRTRFWQTDVGQGGFSKTNLPIGVIHYPDWPDSGISENQRGLLLVYTWGQDALMFGSQTREEAIASAVRQISKIHPEITEQFEVGNVQAWYSDPFSQGAFTLMKPFDDLDVLNALITPTPPIYLAGEALSWSNGWIQGAVFSGLMQAFCFTFHNESGDCLSPLHCHKSLKTDDLRPFVSN